MADATHVTITVDGRPVEVPADKLLIDALETAGVYIPRFCYHPRMKPVGMCRMCLVEVEGPRGTALTTSCTMPVGDGMIVHTGSATVTKAQEGVLEFLLANHPLDCPICDKGGECPLQDQAFAYGPGESRYVEEKRHYEKPIPISDIVLLDRERCILCARCTRFADEIAGDPLIEFKERGNHTEVITFPDEPFSSYFSGNTVQICPVGALTATAFRFKARPWDLEKVESTCSHCSVGCKISIEASSNEVLRFSGIDNDATNHGWLCDKGRFGFEFIGSEERLTAPLIRENDGSFREASWGEALDLVAERIGSLKGEEVAGLGGARSTNEEAYAFAKFLSSVIVTPHADAQLGDGLDPQFLVAGTPKATIDDLERAKTILVWAADLKEELPVLFLRVRRAVTELGAKLIVVHPRRTGLDGIAAHKITYRPGEGTSVLERLAGGLGDMAGAREALGEGPVVAIVGRTGLAEDQRLAEAVAAFARDLPGAGILPVARRSNVFGALDMGLAPTLLPGRVSASSSAGRAALEAHWGPLPEGNAKDAAGILAALAAGDLKGLIMLGSDPVRDFIDPALARKALEAAGFVVAIDLFLTDSNRLADVVLPAEGLGETEGTVTNLEGRVQKVNRIVPGPGQSRAAWSILDDLARRMGAELGAISAAALMKEIAAVAPAYDGIGWDLLDWGEGREGVVVPRDGAGGAILGYLPAGSGPAAASGGSGKFALHLARVLYDDGVHTRMGPSIAGLAPDAFATLHPDDAGRLGVADGTTVKVATPTAAVEVPARLDPTLAAGTVYVPANLAATGALDAVPFVTVEAV